MPVVLVAMIVFFVMLLLLCLPPVICIQMLQRRRVLAPPDQKPAYIVGLVAAAGALAFNFFVCISARPDATIAGVDWTTIGYIHLTALLLSWLTLWASVALAVLVRRRKTPAKPKTTTDRGTGKMA